MDIKLDKASEEYVTGRIESGEFESPGEVVRDALRRHRDDFSKLEALRREIQLGMDDIAAGRVVRPTVEEIIAAARLRKQAQ